MPAAHEFKRVLFGLHQRVVDRASIDFAAELAALLGLDMLGLYLQEPHLARLAALPFAREFNLPARTWRSIDVERFAREYDAAAFIARQLFVDTAATRGVTCEFEIVSASADQVIRSFLLPSDIVVVAEPMWAADRVVGPYPEFAASAIRSEGTVLMLPSRVARKHGAIVAIAHTSSDLSINVARSIAAAANERLVVLSPEAGEPAAAGGSGAGRFNEIVLPASAFALSALLDNLAERMIVATRGTWGMRGETILTDLGALRHIPVLIVEPKAEGN